jgi:dihydrofolate reductase
MLSLIAAISTDGFISRGKGVPWHLPADIAHFRQHTRGKWLLVGRGTFEEMLGWFQPDHYPLILSRDASFAPSVGQRVATLPEALAIALAHSAEELVACGGAQCYAAAMPFADRLLITHVETHLGSGTAFPAIDPDEWIRTEQHEHPSDAQHVHRMTFTTYLRRDR